MFGFERLIFWGRGASEVTWKTPGPKRFISRKELRSAGRCVYIYIYISLKYLKQNSQMEKNQEKSMPYNRPMYVCIHYYSSSFSLSEAGVEGRVKYVH